MSKHEKNPKAKKQPSVEKGAKAVTNPDSYLRLNPSWRISKLCFRDPYGWHVLVAEKIYYIQQKLKDLELMTWNDILVKDRSKHHQIDVSRLCKPAQDYLEDMSIDDIDEVLSLRLTNKERVWGILSGGVVELLWWDPEHEICPSPLKHT